MIVGREMIVGNHGRHPDDDMDELLHHTSVGADPSHEMARHDEEPAHLSQEHHRYASRQHDYRPHHRPREREVYYVDEEPPPHHRRRIPEPTHGPRVVHSEASHEKRRHFPIGFTQSQVQPGQVAEVEVKPQVLFRGERLAVAPSNARSFNT
jgi:hypothetical protein